MNALNRVKSVNRGLGPLLLVALLLHFAATVRAADPPQPQDLTIPASAVTLAARHFPDGDHDLRSTKAPKVDGRAPFVAGYLETITEWALSR
jgi:hypothetical protein